MRKRAAGGHVARIALGLAAPAALVIASAAPALATSGTAATAASTACTDTWVGKATSPQWTIAKNWSAGVPVAASDVCIGTGVDVLTSVSITIHSLRLGPDAGIALEGSSPAPLTATVATSVDLTGSVSRIDLTDSTINAAQINDQGGGTIFTDGTCNLASPDINFGNGGNVQAANGVTTLASLPQLSNGTLTDAGLSTSNATLLLPGDITHLAGSNITVGANSAINDAHGHNALTGLTAVDARSSLTDDNNLTLTGSSFTASGNVTFGGAVVAIGGPFTQAQGILAMLGSATLSATQVTIGHGASMAAAQSTIDGNLVNNGSVAAGFGTVQVQGNYTQAHNASLSSGFGGLLAVRDQASLAGTVSSVEELAQPGDTSPLITFGSVIGGFTHHNLGIRLITRTGEIEALILPQIAASPTTVASRGTVTVTGASFTLGATVQIFLDNAKGAPLVTVGAGYGGRFSVTVVLPVLQAGHHTLIAVGSDGSRAATPLTVS